jgi:G3E family GTPase
VGHRAGRPYFPGGRALKAHIPVAVIGGYLGAGKTTLVNHLLRHAAGRRIAILVNEFGDLPIDEDLIEAEGEDMIAISGGCICCSFGSDLTAALIKLSELAPPPDHVVIEASGVAMPGTVALSISILPGFALAGVVVLADGERVQAQAEDDYIGDTILRQLSDADVIVHSKTDLQPDDGAVEAVESWLQAMAPQAKIVPTTQGRVPPDIILGLTGPNAKPQASPHADAGYESRAFRHIPPCVPGDLAQKLATGPYGVIRAKGFCATVKGPVGSFKRSDSVLRRSAVKSWTLLVWCVSAAVAPWIPQRLRRCLVSPVRGAAAADEPSSNTSCHQRSFVA